jgi:hypothetical protein
VSCIQGIIQSSDKVRERRQTIDHEVPALLAKACELFVTDLAKRAWQHTTRVFDGTLQRINVSAAIKEDAVFDFLLDDVVPLEDIIVLHNKPVSSSSSSSSSSSDEEEEEEWWYRASQIMKS